MSGFVTGLQLQADNEAQPVSTGSPELDTLTGGIRRGLFYLFYGEKPLIENLFLHVLTNALELRSQVDRPVAVYMVCGNYRKERTDIGTDNLMELMEASGFHIEEALRRVHILTASSADQQGFLVDELEALLESEHSISMVLVRGIFKLHRDDARQRNRHVVREEIQHSIIRLRQLCASHNIPLVASGREVKTRRLLPQPDASSFLKHTANIMVYLRERGKKGRYNRAFVLKSPTRNLSSLEYSFVVNDELGRTTPPFRQSFNERIGMLRKEFQEAVVRPERREAFDRLVEAWSGELGAMSFAESMKMLDLMLLVASVDNRAVIEELRFRNQRLEKKLNALEERLDAPNNNCSV
ncbi:MAG: hypothetical protein NWE89_17225 [Candidatus Bathyarchaeota archaeon]|nr:hypothetical protein [Candidatus Bathyarchaeota archaeon]